MIIVDINGIINLCVFGNVFGCEEYGKIIYIKIIYYLKTKKNNHSENNIKYFNACIACAHRLFYCSLILLTQMQ